MWKNTTEFIKIPRTLWNIGKAQQKQNSSSEEYILISGNLRPFC